MSSHYCYQHELIGIEVRGVYDGVLIWQCGRCKKMWPRFTEGKRHQDALDLIEEWEAPLDGGSDNCNANLGTADYPWWQQREGRVDD